MYDAQKPAFFARAAQPWLLAVADAAADAAVAAGGDGGRPTRAVHVPLTPTLGGGGAVGAYVNGSAAAIQALANVHEMVRAGARADSPAAPEAGSLAAALAAGGGAVGLTALLVEACTAVTGVAVQLASGADFHVTAAEAAAGATGRAPVHVLYCGDHLHSDVAAAAAAGGEGAGWHVLAVVEELGTALPVGAATTLWMPGAGRGAPAGPDAGDASPAVTRLPHSVDGTALTPITDPADSPGGVGASLFVQHASPWGDFFEAPRGARSHYCALLERFAWAVTTDVEASLALLLLAEEEEGGGRRQLTT